MLTGQDRATVLASLAPEETSDWDPDSLGLKPGDILSYKLNDELRECHVVDYTISLVNGKQFLVCDGPVGGELVEKVMTTLEMEDLACMAE